MLVLEPAQRSFCRLVAEASVANHFGEGRLQLDQKISQQPHSPSRHELFHTVADRVRQFVEELESKGLARIDQFEGEDRIILELTFLFDLFHQLMEPLDAHIARQLASPAEPLKVTFAEKALQRFGQLGFAPEIALRYFGFFFQLRRAFYFIDQQLTGSSPCMLQLKQSLWKTLFTSDLACFRDQLMERMEDFSVMLLGETGTGKGTAAAAIGRSGYIPFLPEQGRFAASFAASFLATNLSQFPPGLIESELFGHERGAFTGAIHHHKGVLALCSAYGSIFLDEVGEVSIPIQIKLLDVLQTRQFAPVGSHTPQRFRGRIIAASNRDIDALRRENLFRDDFYYRLCSDEIVVPPLRRRIQEDPQELVELVHHRLAAILGQEDSQKAKVLAESILAQVGLDYSWPGNVRELEQCIRRMLVRGEYRPRWREEISDPRGADPSKVVPSSAESSPTAESGPTAEDCYRGFESRQLSAPALVGEYCRYLYERHGTLDKVAKLTGLDWRTVKRYLKE